ncbi:hypothetical protein DFH07DRAFT_408929 [Mycena maculata]|uniref:Uncharacterized protein n=1 Tax=Mycena maculata TaxID=230809 RepID=A0AAD7JD33_9AGAR|nr:hypothetical protein DFH07DRAFT_408929 [Mycena maculata]
MYPVARRVQFWVDLIFYEIVTIFGKVMPTRTLIPSHLFFSLLGPTAKLPRSRSSRHYRLPLSRLWIEFTHFLNVPVAFSPKLTHVELVFWESTGIQAPDISRLIRSLQQLPDFYPLRRESGPQAICSSLPDLRVVIIVRDDARHDYEELEMPNDYSFDARIVTFSRISMDDWEATNFGHDNIWSHAEGVIAQRRARSGSPDRT